MRPSHAVEEYRKWYDYGSSLVLVMVVVLVISYCCSCSCGMGGAVTRLIRHEKSA